MSKLCHNEDKEEPITFFQLMSPTDSFEEAKENVNKLNEPRINKEAINMVFTLTQTLLLTSVHLRRKTIRSSMNNYE